MNNVESAIVTCHIKLRAVRSGFCWHAQHWSDVYLQWVSIPGTENSQPAGAIALGARWHGIIQPWPSC